MATLNHQEDTISHCGSVAGDTISWRRRKRTCSLRQHSIRSGQDVSDLKKSAALTIEAQDLQPRFNTSFHQFRFFVVMMSGMSLGLMMTMRYNISVAILNMVNETALYMEEHPNKTLDDFLAEGYSLGGEFDWNNEVQQMIMSWYMFAYTLPQVPATNMGMKLGGRLAAPISLTICAVSTILTPTVAYWGWEWVVGLRLINGLGAAAVLPMMLYLIEHWMPYEEFSLGLTFAQLIQVIITACSPLACGYLSAIHWSYAFYVPGSLVLMFCLLWIVFITDRPDGSYLVSQRELDRICGCSENKPAEIQTGGDDSDPKTRDTAEQANTTSYTWLDVLRTPTFFAYVFMWIILCSTVNGFFFLLPAYLRQFLKIGVADTGFYCFIIFSGSLIGVLWPHPALRILRKLSNLSETASRRILYSVVCIMVGGSWCYVGHTHSNQLISFFINRAFYNGNDIIVMSTIMRNYAKAGMTGLVFSMINTVGNISIVFASPFMGYILDVTGQSNEGWSWIFYGLGSTQFLMLLAFLTIIRSEPVEFKNRNKNSSEEGKKQPLDGCCPAQVVIDKESEK